MKKTHLGLSPAPISASVRLPHRSIGESGREGSSTWSRASKGWIIACHWVTLQKMVWHINRISKHFVAVFTSIYMFVLCILIPCSEEDLKLRLSHWRTFSSGFLKVKSVFSLNSSVEELFSLWIVLSVLVCAFLVCVYLVYC